MLLAYWDRIPGDVVRKITGYRSRELERYQHLSLVFRAQTVDLIAQVLLSDTVRRAQHSQRPGTA